MKSKYVYIDRGKNTLGSILRTNLVSVVSFISKNVCLKETDIIVQKFGVSNWSSDSKDIW